MTKLNTNTISAVNILTGKVDYKKTVQHMHGQYELEIYHAIRLIKEWIHCTVYNSGKATWMLK